MSRKTLQTVFVSLILISFGYLIGTLTTSCSISAKTTNYQVVPVPISQKALNSVLNKASTEGWDYVDFVTSMREFDLGKGYLIFRK